MGTGQQFCVRWNSYHLNLQNTFPKLLTSEHFVDVTLACENALIKCHKVVLSACSTFFENILIQNPCQHPTIILKDMKFVEVQALVDFMYKGEVNVTQEELPSLLKAADSLQIRGLSGSEQCLNQMNINSQMQGQEESATPTATITADRTISVRPESDLKKKKSEGADTPKTSNASSGDETEINDKENLDESLNDNDESNVKEESIKEEEMTYNDEDLDMDYLDATDEDTSNGANMPGTSNSGVLQPEYPMANVSCQYQKRIRRSEVELRQAAECITRGQTFQNVSDQFNIPISTIRFFMARKGILPRRKRGRSSGVSGMGNYPSTLNESTTTDRSGASSPVGPPYQFVHYKLPELGPKLK